MNDKCHPYYLPIFCVTAAVVILIAMFVAICKKPSRNEFSYKDGYEAGARFASEAFLGSNAYLGPLVISNSGTTISLTNTLFITINRISSYGIIIAGDERSITNVSITGGSFYSRSYGDGIQINQTEHER